MPAEHIEVQIAETSGTKYFVLAVLTDALHIQAQFGCLQVQW